MKTIKILLYSNVPRTWNIQNCGQAPSDYPEEFPDFLIDCERTFISSL